MPANGPADPVLRAKYLDWCSAQIAERFLSLSPEEIYELAFERERSRAQPSSSAREGELDASLARDGSDRAPDRLSYRELVERVTEVLAARLDLPDFGVWLEQYRADPARYEQELMGLWKRPGDAPEKG